MAASDNLIAVWNTTVLPANTTGTAFVVGDSAQIKINKIATWMTLTGVPIRALISSFDLQNALDGTEIVNASGVPQLTQLQISTLALILAPPTVDVSPNSFARVAGSRLLTGKSSSLAKLNALVDPYDNPRVAWWQFVGFQSPVTLGDARAAGLN